MVSASACGADDPGSIPGNSIFELVKEYRGNKRRYRNIRSKNKMSFLIKFVK